MDETRELVLADAGLTEQQRGRIDLRNACGEREDLEHLAVLDDHAGAGLLAGLELFELGEVLVFQVTDLGELTFEVADLIEVAVVADEKLDLTVAVVDRLAGDVRASPRAGEMLHDRVRPAVPAHERACGLGDEVLLHELRHRHADELVAVDAGQDLIGAVDADRDEVAVRDLDRVGRVLNEACKHTVVFEELEELIVVHRRQCAPSQLCLYHF